MKYKLAAPRTASLQLMNVLIYNIYNMYVHIIISVMLLLLVFLLLLTFLLTLLLLFLLLLLLQLFLQLPCYTCRHRYLNIHVVIQIYVYVWYIYVCTQDLGHKLQTCSPMGCEFVTYERVCMNLFSFALWGGSCECVVQWQRLLAAASVHEVVRRDRFYWNFCVRRPVVAKRKRCGTSRCHATGCQSVDAFRSKRCIKQAGYECRCAGDGHRPFLCVLPVQPEDGGSPFFWSTVNWK